MSFSDKPTASSNLDAKRSELEHVLQAMGRVALAFSGGVDSTLLLRVSADCLGANNVLAITVSSPVHPDREQREAATLAQSLGVPHILVESDELQETEPSELATKEKEVILLVDDEQMMVDVTKQMLERLGYTVVAKTSSIDALETFQEEPDEFDLVITDQVMPNMTGTQLAQELISVRPDIAIILCSGFPENVCPEELKSIGIKEFIAKPIGRKEIATIIRKVLEKSSVTA